MFNKTFTRLYIYFIPNLFNLISLFRFFLFSTFCFFKVALYAQPALVTPDTTVVSKDIGDVVKSLSKKNKTTAEKTKPRGLAILPSFGYNPSFGFVVGAKVVGSKLLGDASNTAYSTIGLEAIVTSKGIITLQAIHNIFTQGNKLNWQGNWQLSKFGILDYGIGTGAAKLNSGGLIIDDFPVQDADSAFPIKYNYIRVNEKVYKKVGTHLYVGGGVSFNIYTSIKDEKLTTLLSTPHQRYSVANGFSPTKYAANGFLLSLQFNSREHPNRSYGGIYADFNLRFNQQWMGSTKSSAQLQYDIRKYWSLSKVNPEHVLAIWHWATYNLSGTIPYLDMPSTGSDTYKRSGRGYTIGRFKGPSFAYAETEYRFPISKNKLISGVCFFNMQTASNPVNKNLFRAFDLAGGTGLRILFKKQTRTTLCIDYSKGQYGSSGIFFGLNEVF